VEVPALNQFEGEPRHVALVDVAADAADVRM
jgi:hypothetical protein